MSAEPEVAAGTVVDDLDCRRCGYNLRLQPREGRCPECGLDVRLSNMPPEFSFPNWRLVRRIRIGLCLFVAAAVIYAIVTVWIEQYGPRWLREGDAIPMTHARLLNVTRHYGLALALLGSAGSLMILASPWLAPRRYRPVLRWMLFLAAMITCVSATPWPVRGPLPRGPVVTPILAYMLAVLAALPRAATMILLWAYLIGLTNPQAQSTTRRALIVTLPLVAMVALGDFLDVAGTVSLVLINGAGPIPIPVPEPFLIRAVRLGGWWHDHLSPIGIIGALLGMAFFLRSTRLQNDPVSRIS